MSDQSHIKQALFTQHEVLQIMEEHRLMMEQVFCQSLIDTFGRDIFTEFNEEMEYDVFLSSQHTERCKNIIKRHYKDILEERDEDHPMYSMTEQVYQEKVAKDQTQMDSVREALKQRDMWGDERHPTGHDILSAIRSRKEKAKNV